MTTADPAQLIDALHSGCAAADLDLRHADLSQADLSGVDLSGVDLSGANLEHATLFKANLRGANLYGANLSHAEMTGADLSEADLTEARLPHAGLGMAVLRGAKLISANLKDCTLTMADFSGACARRATMSQSRMREACLRNADFGDSDLRGVDLTDSEVTEAVFINADLRQARLKRLTGYRKAQWIGTDLRDINFAGAYDLRRFSIDQNYIDEFRKRSRFCSAIFHLWSLTSDCGRSFTLWFGWIAAATLFYSVLYTFVQVDFGTQRTWLSPLYFSVVTMSTLGYGDIVPRSMPAQFVAMLQVMTGYVMLGILLTLFNNKIARRGE